MLFGELINKGKLYSSTSVVFAVTLAVSLGILFAPLAKADAMYNWKDVTIPGGKVKESRISSDGSKLIVLQEGATFNDRKLLVSTDNGANWSSHLAPEGAVNLLTNTDGSKLVVKGKYGQNNIHVSTDGGNSWTTPVAPVESDASLLMSPDGSTLTKCRYGGPLFVSRDNGQAWEQKGNECPHAVFNNGRMIYMDYDANLIKQSTDYGVTWKVIKDGTVGEPSFSTNGNSIFGGYIHGSNSAKLSVDGGLSWNSVSLMPSQLQDAIPEYLGVSDDGKRLFVTSQPDNSSPAWKPVHTSVDGGKTWQDWGDGVFEGGSISMTSDGSKIFAVADNNIYRLGTLQLPQTKTFDVSTKPAPANIDNAVAKSTLAATSLRCYDIAASSVKPLPADGVTSTEARVKILGGLSFNINCIQPSASSDIRISLAEQYDIAKVRVYKKDSAAADLRDITSEVVIKNETIAGKSVTTVSYTAVDGAKYDNDHAVNSVITDPIYFGVVTNPVTPTNPGSSASHPVPTASNTASANSSTSKQTGWLADTGTSVWIFGSLAVVALAAGLALKRYI